VIMVPYLDAPIVLQVFHFALVWVMLPIRKPCQTQIFR
jgi:hypothetical protein